MQRVVHDISVRKQGEIRPADPALLGVPEVKASPLPAAVAPDHALTFPPRFTRYGATGYGVTLNPAAGMR